MRTTREKCFYAMRKRLYRFRVRRQLGPMFLLALLFLGGPAVSAGGFSPNEARMDEDTEGIVLLLRNGKTVVFALSEKPVITTGKELVVKTTLSELSYDYNEVQCVYWDKMRITGINSAKADGKSAVVFRVTDGGIEASGLARGERLQLYTADGALINSTESRSGGTAVLPLPEEKGVYIVRCSSGISYKFVRK